MILQEPHILDFDPHSGDFGLGFFGCSLQSGSYLVQHPDLGLVCYLCNVVTQSQNKLQSRASEVTIEPTDLYHRRIYIEPLALYLTLEIGRFKTLSLDMESKKITIEFTAAADDEVPFTARRLRLQKMSSTRPGVGFKANLAQIRGAYLVPATSTNAEVTWQ